MLDGLAAGTNPAVWTAICDTGLHTLHLPEADGGGGAGLLELCVVAEQFGRALVPGSWLPTVLASGVLAQAAERSPAVVAALAAFAGGCTGALVDAPGLTATPDGDGWILSGLSGPTLGLPGAHRAVVRTAVAGDPECAVWFEMSCSDGTVEAADGTDLTRSVGRLRLDGHRVPRAQLLDVDVDAAELVVAALLAAEAAGIAAWAVDTAVAYVSSREQFGRPVGSFQAVQHKAALMLVRAETAVAAAWDAARAQSASAPQQRLAAAAATVTALPAGVEVALDCITLLGGIGFTWEHDAHLYWRRAVSIAAISGPAPDWAARLGEAALVATREYRLVDPEELPELRARIGAVLDDVAALPPDAAHDLGWNLARGGERQRRLAEAGLVAPQYPQPWGIGAGVSERTVIADEFARRDLAPPTTVVGEWLLPTLLAHGTTDQLERFAGPTLRGDVVWCQLFSEPGAGSDLAALSTRATRVDGGWSLHGQKVWSSYAHLADWGVCLARTDTEAPQHRGISYFLVDMRSAGIEIRPLRQATGDAEFNEAFLDDVFVPDDQLVGPVNEGWELTVATLSSERLAIGTRVTRGTAERVRVLAATTGPGDHRRDVLQVLGRSTAREMALSALNLRNVLTRVAGLDTGARHSIQKVCNALIQREGSLELMTVLGHAGATTEDGNALDHLGLPAVLIGGGTIEIQLNMIAQRVLGLPR